MNLVSRLLELVRTRLFEPHDSGRADRTAPVPESGPRPAEGRPSPRKWAAVLAAARHRRAPHVWPSPELPGAQGNPVIGALVRAYVLTEDERTRLLASPARKVRCR